MLVFPPAHLNGSHATHLFMLLFFSSTFPLLSLEKIIPMESTARNLALSLLLLAFMSQSSAYEFYVGGRDGWGLNPSANYSNWAERNRFQVNDKLGIAK